MLERASDSSPTLITHNSLEDQEAKWRLEPYTSFSILQRTYLWKNALSSDDFSTERSIEETNSVNDASNTIRENFLEVKSILANTLLEALASLPSAKKKKIRDIPDVPQVRLGMISLCPQYGQKSKNFKMPT